jgi:hypothetical protein
VDNAEIMRVARRLFSTTPTIAAIGPLGKVEGYERMVERLKL